MTIVTTVVDQLEDALAALPTEPDEIARVFTELGITGRLGSPCRCPVARYLAVETGRHDVSVGERLATTGPCDVWMPEHVKEFIRRFDGEQYPQLITRPEVA